MQDIDKNSITTFKSSSTSSSSSSSSSSSLKKQLREKREFMKKNRNGIQREKEEQMKQSERDPLNSFQQISKSYQGNKQAKKKLKNAGNLGKTAAQLMQNFGSSSPEQLMSLLPTLMSQMNQMQTLLTSSSSTSSSSSSSSSSTSTSSSTTSSSSSVVAATNDATKVNEMPIRERRQRHNNEKNKSN